jgi:hypothetical protein
VTISIHARLRDYNLTSHQPTDSIMAGTIITSPFDIMTVAGENLATVAGEDLIGMEGNSAFLYVINARKRDYNLVVHV